MRITPTTLSTYGISINLMPVTGGLCDERLLRLSSPIKTNPVVVTPLTPDQVKDQFEQLGNTFTAWAEQNGYTANEVYRVLNGQAKGKYGKSHEIAVKLGLKLSAEQVANRRGEIGERRDEAHERRAA